MALPIAIARAIFAATRVAAAVTLRRLGQGARAGANEALGPGYDIRAYGIYLKLAQRIQEIAINRKRTLTNNTWKTARRLAPVDTGRLRRSIRITSNSATLSRIEPGVNYAVYAEAHEAFMLSLIHI